MINEIKKIPIIDILAYYNICLSTYSNKIVCPFPDHKESEPSFHLRQEKNSFKCFGCGRGGSAIDFVMGMERVDVYSAIRILADRYNMHLGDHFNQEQKYFDSFALYILKHQEKAFSYLKSRKVSEKVISAFNIGYCPKTFPSLSEKYTEFYLKSGIIYPNFPKGYHWSLQNRIVFPVKTSSGYYLGFVGRTDNKDEDTRYLNSKFEKSKTLFGWNIAKKYIYQKQVVYLVEGIFDVLAFYSQGIYNVVSTLGTSLSNEQKNLLSNNLNIILVYDGDSAGQKAILKIAESIKDIKKIELPEGEDVASLHEKGYYLKDLIEKETVDVIADLRKKDAVSAYKIALQQTVSKSEFLTVKEIFKLADNFGISTDEAYQIYLGLSKSNNKIIKYQKKQKHYRKVKYGYY